jgi:nucleoside-diphosphate-sugar epimerase
MRVLIAGATGAIGRPLVRRLRANQHEVFALSRSLDSAPALEEIGGEAVMADALDPTAVKAAVGRILPDAVINELTSPPQHYTAAEMKATAERDRKVRVEGNINLLAAFRDAGVRRFLVCARRGTGGRVRPVHFRSVPRSRGQRPYLPGIGSVAHR